MPSEKQDRRSQRTRRLLGEAFVGLLSEKRYDTITVQDIVERADVGRTTYYAHFRDKEDLLLSEIDRVVHQLGNPMLSNGEAARRPLPSLALFRHVQENRSLYQALMWGRGFESVFKQVQAQLTATIEQRLADAVQTKAPPAVPLPVVADFLAGSFITMLKWWMDGKRPYSAEAIDDMYWRLVMPGLASVLGVEL